MAATPFDTAGPLSRLATIWAGIVGIQQVYSGAPESIGARVAVYVTAGSQIIRPLAGQVYEREARYFCGLCYAVEGAEATAETTLAAALDAFIVAIYADRTLGGTSYDTTIDFALVDDPLYRVEAGMEYRIFPIQVVTIQRQTFGL